MDTRSAHWNDVYGKRAPNEVSWFQAEAHASLALIAATGCPTSASIIDVGAGASTLADGLLARGFSDVTLLDIAEAAFAETRRRLPDTSLNYVVADITTWRPERAFDLWHDRAVFHFLTEEKDRAAYRSALAAGLRPAGHVILGTFATDGPERCSGLPVQRYSAESLAAEFAGLLEPVESRHDQHSTPNGAVQSFVFVRFRRRS